MKKAMMKQILSAYRQFLAYGGGSLKKTGVYDQMMGLLHDADKKE